MANKGNRNKSYCPGQTRLGGLPLLLQLLSIAARQAFGIQVLGTPYIENGRYFEDSQAYQQLVAAVVGCELNARTTNHVNTEFPCGAATAVQKYVRTRRALRGISPPSSACLRGVKR